MSDDVKIAVIEAIARAPRFVDAPGTLDQLAHWRILRKRWEK